jgi:hypothetical protein
MNHEFLAMSNLKNNGISNRQTYTQRESERNKRDKNKQRERGDNKKSRQIKRKREEEKK